MPEVLEAIDKMTTSEKFETMDYILSSISANGDVLTLSWHERELLKTEARVAAGTERPMPWEAAKAILRGA